MQVPRHVDRSHASELSKYRANDGKAAEAPTAVLSIEAARGARDPRRSRHPWRSPRPVAGGGYGEELSLRLIPSFFMRCLRVPGFNPSLAAAPAPPSMTQ